MFPAAMGSVLMSQGETVPPALPGDIFSWDKLTSVRGLSGAERSRSLDLGWPELGHPPQHSWSHQRFQPWLQSLLSLPPAFPAPCLGGPFAAPSPSAGVLEQEGCANYSFPGRDSFVLLSSPFPGEPGGGGREYGLLQGMKEKGKRKPGGPAEGEEGAGGGNRKQSKCANSLVRVRGILRPGI